MKAIYVVRGSEDGNVAAVTSAKRAARIAVEYLEGCDDLTADVADLARTVRQDGYAVVHGVWDYNVFPKAEIERFYD